MKRLYRRHFWSHNPILSATLAATLFLAASAFPQTLPPTNNLVLWLKAGSLSLTDGQSVTYWADSSGNGHDAVLLPGWNAPTFATNGVNGHPGVFFGPAASLRITNNVGAGGTVLLPSGLTFAAAFKTFSATPSPGNGLPGNVLIEDNTGNRAVGFGVSSGLGDFQSYQNSPAGWYGVPSSYAVDNTNTYQGHFLVATHSSSSGLAQLYADQRYQGSNSIAYNAATGFNIIGDYNGARYFNGWVSELLVYSTDLTGTDLAQLQTYLTGQALDVPEPSAVLLLGVGTLLCWNRRRMR